jgi:hypothetical protein
LIEVARLTLHSSKVPSVEWEVEYTDAFEEWWDSLDEDEQESVDDRWYDKHVTWADKLYDRHVEALKKKSK